MSGIGFQPTEILPREGLLRVENRNSFVLCKPKLLPLKSVTLERLDKMQKAAQDKVRADAKAEQDKFFEAMSTSDLQDEQKTFEDDYEALTRSYYSGQ